MARTVARLPNGTRVSDHVALGVLTATIPADLVDAVLAETDRQSQRQRQLPALATKSAITRVRRRLGVMPLERLFQRLACPFAAPATPGAWYRGRRLLSL